MKELNLHRFKSTEQGTLGILTAEGFSAKTIELPWNDNVDAYSCIPVGEYEIMIRLSPRFGWSYIVKDVPDREYILTHWGNVAGDTRAGFKSHSEGCIIIGTYHGKLNGQDAVLASRIKFNRFMTYMSGEDGKLSIKEV